MASSEEWNEIRNVKDVKLGHMKEEWGDEERKKRSEVGGGKSTSIIGQAVVQGNVEVLGRGSPFNISSVMLHLFQRKQTRGSSAWDPWPKSHKSLNLSLSPLTLIKINAFMDLWLKE